MNEILETESFSKLYDACDSREKQWINKIKDKLRENLTIGKPLRFDWFREKRFGNKRLFYVVNVKTEKAALIAFGEKKDQQKIIDSVVLHMDFFLGFVN
jgi:hypothetical protein